MAVLELLLVRRTADDARAGGDDLIDVGRPPWIDQSKKLDESLSGLHQRDLVAPSLVPTAWNT
jgi:hypothetical protein